MREPRRTAKRIDRRLTEDEQARLALARRETEAQSEEILRDGRAAKQAWEVMRGEVAPVVDVLRAGRERLGWSLADAEQRCGLRRSVLSRPESDRCADPTWLAIERYALALGLRVHATLQLEKEAS